MAPGRRNSDRRRRVLYTTHHADSTPSTAASRRAAERLREARRPTAAYGIRVQRRLRGRWFSLVPVRRRTLITVASVLACLALVLCAAHYASVAWPSIAYRPEIARPLRLDRPDSFGRWITCALLAGSAGASLLIYQLRRYRIDDYQGRYRLWRLILIVLMLASVNSLVSIIDWGGAIMEAGFGKRVALSGSDWIRLVVSIGGAILALRMIAEVRRSRLALGAMIAASALLAIPEAAKWHVLKVESMGVWVLVTSAPLLAFTTLFISLASYLRMLYREVRQIEENDSLADRMQRFKVKVFQRSQENSESESESDNQDEYEEEDEEDQPRPRRWFGRRSRSASAAASNRQDEEEEEEYEEEEEEDQEELAASDADETSQSEESAKPRRRWFGLRRGKVDVPAADDDEQSEEEPEQAAPPAKAKKRRRFSLRLDPAAAGESNPSDDDTQQADDSQDTDESKPASKPKRGLGGWLRAKKSASDDAEQQPSDESPPAAKPATSQPDEPDDDTDDIDWDSMSKSERRRLRKKLRRQGRAA